MPRLLQRRLMLAASTLLALGVPLPARAQEPVTVVVAGPFTGASATVGDQMRHGAELAIKDLNDAGGLQGRPVRMEVQDDACDPRQAVSVANLVATRRVRFVVGHACSGSSIPASAVYAEEGVLMISPASSNPALTDDAAAKGWGTILRLYGRDDAQGDFVGGWLAANRRGARVAVVDDQTAYGCGLAQRVRASLAANGMASVLDAGVVRGERDFNAVIARLKEAKPDLLYFGGYPLEAGLLLRQAREQGLQATLMSGDSLVTPDFWAVTGPAGAGTIMTFPPEPRNNPAAGAVVSRMRAAGFDPEGYTLYSYASVQAIVEGAKRSGSLEPARIAAALRGGAPVATVLGPVAFDAKGDVRDPRYAIYMWQPDGQYKEQP